MNISAIALVTLVGFVSLAPAHPVAAQGQRSQRQAQERSFIAGGAGSRIGVSIRELRDGDLSAAKLTRAEGVFIESVEPDTPAGRAGIRTGDIVVDYDGEGVRGARHFARLVQETPAGRTVPIVVNRAGTRQTLNVTPEEGSAGSVDLGELRDRLEERLPDLPLGIGQRAGERRFGVTLTPLSSQLASYFGVRSGALVSEVIADSAAARANVKAGDVITAVNGRSVDSPADVVAELRGANGDATADLTLMRDKQQVNTQMRIGDRASRPPRRTVGI